MPLTTQAFSNPAFASLRQQLEAAHPRLRKRPPLARLAPTPSGHLHLGNIVNFLLTWLLTRGYDGILHLRIDDMDSSRCREAYVEELFRTLDWVGLDWDEGPFTVAEFYAAHSFSLRRDYFRDTMSALQIAGACYACVCSRQQIASTSVNGLYPGTCRDAAHLLRAGDSALRFRVRPGTTIAIGLQEVRLDRALGDFIVWRRDDLPAYQLASVIDDRDRGTSLFVRGEDLLVSSAAQYHIAGTIAGGNRFQDAVFLHHPLFTDASGRKLSKSTGAPAVRARWRKEHLYRQAARLLDLPGGEYGSTGELLAGFISHYRR